jgi:release factor glutamine methyltransferase
MKVAPGELGQDGWTVRRALAWTTQRFEKKGIDAPRLTAEVLLAHCLGHSRVQLYVELDRPLDKVELAAFRQLIERRSAGEPTHYLTGKREFYGRAFRVDARVLVPRPETELLVEAVLRHVPKDAPARLLDLCTGSGCIAATLAAERPQASVWATDLSKEACALAAENAEALGVGARVTVRQGDLFAPLPHGARFDVLVSNPPYIPTSALPGLPPEVRHEPKMALDGGVDGLALVRRIAQEGLGCLRPGGLLALEIGEEQGAAVVALLGEAGWTQPRVEKDLARLDRLALAVRPQGG